MTPSPAPPPPGGRPPDPQPADASADDLDTGGDEGALDERLDAEHHPDLGDALRALLDPAGDVRSRAADKVDRSLQGRSMVSTLTDLSGVGWVTVAHLLTSPPGTADRNERSEDRDD